MSQFTCENDFMHYAYDEDHGSRRVGRDIGVIRKPYKWRERMMAPYFFIFFYWNDVKNIIFL